MDVSPKQLVSVAAALIPFLENDDANRALMGSNMQRQAVPLVRADAPFVGTGMEAVVARDFRRRHPGPPRGRGGAGRRDPHRRARHGGDRPDQARRRHLPPDEVPRSNQSTCINQRPLVRVGDTVRKGDVVADGPSTDLGELALGRNVLVAFMPWNGYNFEDIDPSLREIVSETCSPRSTSRSSRSLARDTKLGPEEITRDNPNVAEESPQEPR